jgi:hypothetical protein
MRVEALRKGLMGAVPANNVESSPFVLIHLFLLLKVSDVGQVGYFQTNHRPVCSMAPIANGNVCLSNLFADQYA